MSSPGDEPVNFQLVSTYVPLLLLLLRSVLLLTAAHLCAALLEAHGALLVILAVLVYFDAHAFRHNKLNQACGFLCPVALCVLQARVAHGSQDCEATYLQVALWSVDMVWAVSCTSYVAIVCYKGYFVVRVLYAALGWAACAVVHALAACAPLDFPHQLIRTVLYYLTCTLFFYVKCSSPLVDRGSYQFAVLHVFVHIFFVQHYVLLGSVVAAAVVFGAAYYVKVSSSFTRPAHKPYAVTAYPAPACGDAESSDLMRELRAAQKSAECA